jgi:hypothetical protein
MSAEKSRQMMTMTGEVMTDDTMGGANVSEKLR